MLSQRITTARNVVSLFDPALDEISIKKRQLYAGSRDLADLGDLSVLSSKPTIFRCLSLTTAFEDHRILFLEENSANSAWIIFAFHVESVKNFPEAPARISERGQHDLLHLPDSARELFGPEAILEVARVICEMPDRSSTSPFSVPPTWGQAQQKRSTFRALREAIVLSTKDEDTTTVPEENSNS